MKLLNKIGLFRDTFQNYKELDQELVRERDAVITAHQERAANINALCYMESFLSDPLPEGRPRPPALQQFLGKYPEHNLDSAKNLLVELCKDFSTYTVFQSLAKTVFNQELKSLKLDTATARVKKPESDSPYYTLEVSKTGQKEPQSVQFEITVSDRNLLLVEKDQKGQFSDIEQLARHYLSE